MTLLASRTAPSSTGSAPRGARRPGRLPRLLAGTAAATTMTAALLGLASPVGADVVPPSGTQVHSRAIAELLPHDVRGQAAVVHGAAAVVHGRDLATGPEQSVQHVVGVG